VLEITTKYKLVHLLIKTQVFDILYATATIKIKIVSFSIQYIPYFLAHKKHRLIRRIGP